MALLPVDGSWHVLSATQVEAVAARLGAAVIVPHHYAIWDLTTRASTLLPPDAWVNGRAGSRRIEGGAVRFDAAEVRGQSGQAWCFGEGVAFEKVRIEGSSP